MNDEILNNAGDAAAIETPSISESNPEADVLRAENESLKHALRTRAAGEALMAELKAAGARSPELLIANAQNDIQFDDDGEPINTAAVAAALIRKYPEQFGAFNTPSIDAGAGRTNRNNFLTRETLAKMKPEEIARLDWNDVRQVLAN